MDKKITIIKNGPYLVKGNIPLTELIIVPTENGNVYKEGRIFESQESYALCRCGKSKNKPFCDGSHGSFNGKLTASKDLISNRSKKYYGKKFILEDAKDLCAFARFCHSKDSDVWNAVENDDEALAIKLTTECPAGRLVIRNRETNEVIEPNFKPSIVLLQDPAEKCSGPIWVRGKIIIYDDEGNPYEGRNRVTLCRCGKSENKPFCDATHVSMPFNDNN